MQRSWGLKGVRVAAGAGGVGDELGELGAEEGAV